MIKYSLEVDFIIKMLQKYVSMRDNKIEQDQYSAIPIGSGSQFYKVSLTILYNPPIWL